MSASSHTHITRTLYAFLFAEDPGMHFILYFTIRSIFRLNKVHGQSSERESLLCNCAWPRVCQISSTPTNLPLQRVIQRCKDAKMPKVKCTWPTMCAVFAENYARRHALGDWNAKHTPHSIVSNLPLVLTCRILSSEPFRKVCKRNRVALCDMRYWLVTHAIENLVVRLFSLHIIQQTKGRLFKGSLWLSMLGLLRT